MNRILIAFLLLVALCLPVTAKEYPPLQLPKVEKQMAENGMTILYVEHHELPVVTVRMLFKVGSAADPVGKEGLANFVADLLTEGANGKTATQMANGIESIGGTLSSSCGDADLSWAELSCLKKHLPEALPLFSDMVLRPDFPETEVQRFRQQYMAQFEQEKEDPWKVTSNLVQRLGFAGTPYAHKVEGSAKSLAGITRQDIMDFYKKWYRPNNVILIVSGDITKKEIAPLFESAFGKWTPDAVPTLDYGKLAPIVGRKILIIDKPDMDQAYIAMFRPGTKRNTPDYFALRLMNYILGEGSFSSRLMQEVREKAGLTYSIYSYFWVKLHNGIFAVETFTKNETVGEATKKILVELDRMRNEPVSQKELDDAISNYCGGFPMDFETPQQIASRYAGVEIYSLGDNYLRDFRKNYGGVKATEVQAAAKKYVDPANISIIVYGNAAAIKSQLEPLGTVEVKPFTQFEE